MKFLVATFAVLAVLACTSAFVVPNGFDTHHDSQMVRLEDVDSDGGLGASPTDQLVRQRRLTCDFFSFESSVVTPNHAACALKCVGMGRGGGHCEGTTCVCRNDKWVPW